MNRQTKQFDFYHKEEFEQLKECPPRDYRNIECECYRWVFSTIDDSRNFLSQAEKNPKALNDKTDKEKCEYYALSFHMSFEKSKEHYKILKKTFKNIPKNIGTHIAKGLLVEENGLGGETDNMSHFNFHFTKSKEFCSTFEIVEEL